VADYMSSMSIVLEVLPWLIGAGMVMVVGVLFTGIVGMGLGGQFNARHGNRLMRLRVISQAVVIAFLVLYFLLRNIPLGGNG
jgi:hypothetical protein